MTTEPREFWIVKYPSDFGPAAIVFDTEHQAIELAEVMEEEETTRDIPEVIHVREVRDDQRAERD